MAKEYIERGELIADLNKFAPEAYSRAVDLVIRNQPAADVVEVVRCGKCIHAFEWPLNELLCKRKMLGRVRPEDFCSFGERRDNNAAD